MRTKRSKVNPMAEMEANRHEALAAAYMSGASKVLSDFIGGTAYGTDLTIETSQTLLRRADWERKAAHRGMLNLAQVNPLEKGRDLMSELLQAVKAHGSEGMTRGDLKNEFYEQLNAKGFDFLIGQLTKGEGAPIRQYTRNRQRWLVAR